MQRTVSSEIFKYLPLLIFLTALFFGGFLDGSFDTLLYQQYALTFWQGDNIGKQAFQFLPKEYPALSLIPFSLPLLTPFLDYRVGFAFFMLIFVVGLYLYYFAINPYSSFIFAIYIIAGSMTLTSTRFDIIPATIVLLSLILAVNKKFIQAYFFLGLAAIFKIYPMILFIPLFIQQQLSFHGKFSIVQRLKGATVFLAVCVLGFIAPLIISYQAAISPINTLIKRPIEIESMQGSLLWVLSQKFFPICWGVQYGSINIYEKINGVCKFNDLNQLLVSASLEKTFLIFEIIFIGWVAKLQISKKLNFKQAFLAVLLIIIGMNKVFSPQYLIWLTPIIVYVLRFDIKMLLFYFLISVSTTFIYPYSFQQMQTQNNSFIFTSPTMAIILLRNILFTLFTVIFIVRLAKQSDQHKLAAKIQNCDKLK